MNLLADKSHDNHKSQELTSILFCIIYVFALFSQNISLS